MKKSEACNFRIALVQSEYDPMNMEAILKYISWSEKADIICFPEAFAAGRTIEKTSSYIKLLLEHRDVILQQVSQATGSCVVLPLVDRTEDGTLYNASFVIDKGEVRGSYRKIHVFPWGEFFFDCGEDHYVYKHEKCRVGIMICYDAAFPETSRILAMKGADVIIISASWPEEAMYLWKSRLVARAQDNQVFLAGVNRCGWVENEHYIGGSIVINPRGEILAQCGNAEQILVMDIDLGLIEKERDQEPVWLSFDRSLYEPVLNKKNNK